MSIETPVETPTVETPVEGKKETAKPSPAQDLRDIQSLLVCGIFPGQMAPAIVKSYQVLEHLASKVELDAKNEAEFKARQAL